MNQKIETLLLDLDETLVQSTGYRVHLDFTYRFLNWWKPYAPRWRTLLALQKLNQAIKPNRTHAPIPLKETNHAKGLSAFAHVMDLSLQEAGKLMTPCLEEIFPTLKRHFSPVPGAKRFVHWAHAHFPLFLATNPVWPPEIVEMRLKWAGLDLKYFHSFTHAKRMSSCKPHVNYYREFTQQENLNPRTCLMIGDDLKRDGPAIQLGMQVIILSGQSKLSLQRGTQGLLWNGSFSAIQEALQGNLNGKV